MNAETPWFVDVDNDGLHKAVQRTIDESMRVARSPEVNVIAGPYMTLPEAMLNVSQGQEIPYVEWYVAIDDCEDALDIMHELIVAQDLLIDALGYDLRIREINTKRIDGHASGRAIFHIVKVVDGDADIN